MKFDIIGDIHGCYNELLQLLDKLGYSLKSGLPVHPNGRKLAFVGDAMDRGSQSVETINFLYNLQDADLLIYSPGNHCNKFYRYAKGSNVQITHGLETTVKELDLLATNERDQFLKRYVHFYNKLPLYHVLDDGKLIVVHAGIRKDMIGVKFTEKIRVFTQYGDITGKKHPDGKPVRRDWAKQYKEEVFIVYGHTPVHDARFINQTVNIDTGCVFGGKLTAIRYPEMEVISVPSTMPYVKEKFTTFK